MEWIFVHQAIHYRCLRTVASASEDIQALLPPATLTYLNPMMNLVPALGQLHRRHPAQPRSQ